MPLVCLLASVPGDLCTAFACSTSNLMPSLYRLAAITYAQEISPTVIRGAMGGSVGIALMVGYFVAGWTGVGFYFVSSEINWRIVVSCFQLLSQILYTDELPIFQLILQLISPLVTLIGLPFVPESPRFYSKQGMSERSLEVLRNLHKSARDPDFLIAREEHFQIEKQAVLDKVLG
jgi:MFS family permease